jgi:hypothetical protein
MKQDTFQKALIATAKITCCASLFGLACNKKVPVVADPLSNASENIVETMDSSANKIIEVTIASVDHVESSYNQECKDLLTETFQESSSWPETMPQEVKDCCNNGIEHYISLEKETDRISDTNTLFQWEYKDQCCDALDWNPRTQTIACTPWGPPMPPKFAVKTIRHPKILRRILVRST